MPILPSWAKKFLCLLVLGLLADPGCGPDLVQPLPVGPFNGWRVFHPAPIGYELQGVWTDRPDDTWAVGDFGVIVHWDGITLRQVDSPTQEDLTAMDGWSRDDIYAIAKHLLLHYDGRTWEVLDRFPEATLTDVLCAPNDHRLLVAGTMGVLVRQGTGWQAVSGPSEQTGILWIGDDGQARVGDLDVIWRVDGSQAVREFAFGDGVIKAADGRFVVRLSDEGGAMAIHQHDGNGDWSLIIAEDYNIQAIVDLAGDPVWATSWDILDSGTTIFHYNPGRWLLNLVKDPAGNLLACGWSGTLVRGLTQASGTFRWSITADDPGYHALVDFDGRSSRDFWGLDYYGSLLHYDDGTWTVFFFFLMFSDHAEGFQVLADGSLIIRTDTRLLRWQENLPVNYYTGSSATSYLDSYAFSADSLLATDADGAYLWVGGTRTRVYDGPVIQSLARTPDGELYGLTSGDPSRLVRWNGRGFDDVLSLPGFHGEKLTAQTENSDLWLAGSTVEDGYHVLVYRFREGRLRNMTSGSSLPPPVLAMGALRPDDIFLMTGEQVWRYHDGIWAREQGLPPTDPYFTLWCSPDKHVFVEGLPTYCKDFTRE